MIVDLRRSGQCHHPSLDMKVGGSGVCLQLSVPEPDSDRGSILGHQHSLCRQKKPQQRLFYLRKLRREKPATEAAG